MRSINLTKTNFTSSSFTVRGINGLCVGFSCDLATAIHVNDMPHGNSTLAAVLSSNEFFAINNPALLG